MKIQTDANNIFQSLKSCDSSDINYLNFVIRGFSLPFMIGFHNIKDLINHITDVLTHEDYWDFSYPTLQGFCLANSLSREQHESILKIIPSSEIDCLSQETEKSAIILALKILNEDTETKKRLFKLWHSMYEDCHIWNNNVFLDQGFCVDIFYFFNLLSLLSYSKKNGYKN